jgi:hypothetical protein
MGLLAFRYCSMLFVVFIVANTAHCFIAVDKNSVKSSRLLTSISIKQRMRQFQANLFDARKVRFPLNHRADSADDDEISQHEYMDENANKTSETTNSKTTGYRRIEDWHEDQVTKNPQHVLTRLQQEQALWKNKFEDVGGDGI